MRTLLFIVWKNLTLVMQTKAKEGRPVASSTRVGTRAGRVIGLPRGREACSKAEKASNMSGSSLKIPCLTSTALPRLLAAMSHLTGEIPDMSFLLGRTDVWLPFVVIVLLILVQLVRKIVSYRTMIRVCHMSRSCQPDT